MTADEPVLAASIPIRPAATVMLVRDGNDGLEVFMLQRTFTAAFARGQFVFPGGMVDDADHADELEPICDGLDDASASARLGLDHGGLAWLVAAIREGFEEAGVLLARRHDEHAVVGFDNAEVADRFNDARHAIHEGARSLADLCRSEQLLLLTDRVHLVDHWVTPVGERRRFDTRFFVAAAPNGQQPLHDDKETIASLWVRPEDALGLHRAGELAMLPPTIAALGFLEPFATVDEAVAGAEAVGIPPTVLPRLILDDDGHVRGIKVEGEPGYDDVPIPEHVIGNPR